MAKITLVKQMSGHYIDRAGKQYTALEGQTMLDKGEAKLAKWHGSGKKKAATSYEGNQYTGGRKEGKKNLKKIEGGVVNEHNIAFTNEEKKLLEQKVNSVNRKRKRQLEKEGKMPRFNAGEYTGGTVKDLQNMSSESDFIIARKSKSLQQFKSKEDFYKYMDRLDYILQRNYEELRTEMYKKNHITAIENVFGHAADDVIEKIKSLSADDYRTLVVSDEVLEVGYIYLPVDLENKLNQIRAALGLNQSEVHFDGEN